MNIETFESIRLDMASVQAAQSAVKKAWHLVPKAYRLMMTVVL